MTATTCTNVVAFKTAPAAPRRHRGLLAKVLNKLRLWKTRLDGRRELRALDDHMLADIGLTRAEADYEAAKPFWKA